ncbi:hypothetical protein [Chitinophaga sp. YIM B06452]|uniref:hypothetical protein n=1 Tax=Chitinophaga sp. YIM B06452 TaxID=3082158 RepID=UPI0031FE4913
MRYLLPLICLIACGTAAKEKNPCENIRTGEFKLKGPDNSKTWTILRNDSTQEEINHYTGKSVNFSVKWTSPCEYELRLISSSDTSVNFEMLQKSVIKVTVTNVNDNFYDFTTHRSPDSFSVSGRMQILKLH